MIFELICGITALRLVPVLSFGKITFDVRNPAPGQIVLRDDWAPFVGFAIWAIAIAGAIWLWRL